MAVEDACRLVEVEHGETDSVDGAGDGFLDAVVDEEPAVVGLDERRADSDPERVPPGAVAWLKHGLGQAPGDEVVGAGEEDRSSGAAEGVHGPVEEDPLAVDALGQESGVLVLGALDDAVPLDGAEVSGGREEDGGTGRAVGGAGDREPVELLDPDGTCVFESPDLGLVAGARCEQRLGSDRPAVDAVRGACDGEVRDPRAVFDTREERGLAVDERRSRVEDGVGSVRPVFGGEDRIPGIADKELCREPACRLLQSGHAAATALVDWWRTTTGSSAVSSASCARWKASVDSAPSFPLMSSSPRPSPQPPVAKS